MDTCVIGQREIIDYMREVKLTTLDNICKHFNTSDRSKIINRLGDIKKHGYILEAGFVNNRYEEIRYIEQVD